MTPRFRPATAAADRDDGTDLALKLWVVLARSFRAVEAHAEADIARHDLTLAEFGVIEALHHKGPLLLGDLQRRILVSRGGEPGGGGRARRSRAAHRDQPAPAAGDGRGGEGGGRR